MPKDVMPDARDRMTKAVEALRKDLAAIRTGRASVGLVDHVRVDYHGTPMPINQLATVSVPEPRLLTIQPWDRGALDPRSPDPGAPTPGAPDPPPPVSGAPTGRVAHPQVQRAGLSTGQRRERVAGSSTAT